MTNIKLIPSFILEDSKMTSQSTSCLTQIILIAGLTVLFD